MDYLRFLLGDIVEVNCVEGLKTRGHEVEETGAVALVFKNGAVGTYLFSEYVSVNVCH
jgi:predicted dehydrogenase